jgi:hypothetical protein
MSRKLFSDKEDSVLKEFYSKLTNKKLVEIFNGQHSINQIKWRAKEFCLKKDKETLNIAQNTRVGCWQEWEEEIIKRHFKTGGAEKCLEFLPERSEASIKHKAYRMKIHLDYNIYCEHKANGPKHHSEETKEKLSKLHKEKVFSKEHLENIRKNTKSGEDHYNWKGGRSFKDYGPEFNNQLRNKVKGRDGYRCQKCKEKHSWKRIHIHHIDYDKTNNSIENLITLCISCHMKHHQKISEYEQLQEQNYFKALLGPESLELMNSNIHLEN